MKLIQSLLTKDKYNIKCPYTMNPTGLVSIILLMMLVQRGCYMKTTTTKRVFIAAEMCKQSKQYHSIEMRGTQEMEEMATEIEIIYQ